MIILEISLIRWDNYGQDITFLKKSKLTEDQCLKAIRHSLKHSTLFLKRSPLEIRINNYNPNLLKGWRANMDLQFVLDSYTCAVYVLSFLHNKRFKEESFHVKVYNFIKRNSVIFKTHSNIKYPWLINSFLWFIDTSTYSSSTNGNLKLANYVRVNFVIVTLVLHISVFCIKQLPVCGSS